MVPPETPDTWFEKPFVALTKGGKIRDNFGTFERAEISLIFRVGGILAHAHRMLQ